MQSMRDRMAADPEGAEILRDRPRVTTESIGGFDRLLALPEHTFGHAYAKCVCARKRVQARERRQD